MQNKLPDYELPENWMECSCDECAALNGTFVLTDNIVRDKLSIYGEMGLLELTQTLGLQIGVHNNLVMSHLAALMDSGQVSYDSHAGTYKSNVVL